MATRRLTLPLELLVMVFEYCATSKSSLANASRASKLWYRLVFPILNRKITIKKFMQLEALMARRVSEGETGALRVGRSLRTLIIDLSDDIIRLRDAHPPVVFENLSSLCIECNSYSVETLVGLISICPNLTDLAIGVLGHPSEILASLKSPLPKLRSIALFGWAPDETLDLQSTINGSLGNFFRAHPHIEGITMKWIVTYARPPRRINPLLIPSIFPGLKSFCGPIDICTALVASELRHQLKYLGVRNNASLYNEFEAQNSLLELAAAAKLLPNLECLQFAKFDTGRVSPMKLSGETLLQIIAATPALTCLDLRCLLVSRVDLFRVLERAPLLNAMVFLDERRECNSCFSRFVQTVKDVVHANCPKVRAERLALLAAAIGPEPTMRVQWQIISTGNRES
ncbi:hypothetical protein CTheo_7959 [Ceratobasidium theobromae]|uniref:F-box domain-containing protein n=1 Tax=Ceratobasidium theobromae TaxID=1582974 RepID=A0A5N5Q9Y3_9AGAM|nr:hypothetical protein CTheo_7959 [Ceratobasidium theobromae]